MMCAALQQQPVTKSKTACEALAGERQPTLTSGHGREGHFHPECTAGRRGSNRGGSRRRVARRLPGHHPRPRTRADDRAARAALVAGGNQPRLPAGRSRLRRQHRRLRQLRSQPGARHALFGRDFRTLSRPGIPGPRHGPPPVRGGAPRPQRPRLCLDAGLGARRQSARARLLHAARRQDHPSRRGTVRRRDARPRCLRICRRDGALNAPASELAFRMRLDAIAIGKDPPNEVNVIIEVPIGGEPIKYEMDKEAGTLVVDRFLYTPMRYPGNYGFIPHTLSEDGDPCDVLIVNTRAIIPGAVMSVRPVGVLFMEDEAGGDEKILAVPSSKLTQRYDKVKSYSDLPDITLQQIQHFFEHYKDLEKGKWVKILRWGGPEDAQKLILEGIEREKKKKA